MKTAIAYQSTHHGNTKKLLDAIAAETGAELIDVTAVREKDLGEYDLIGFASGISFSKYYPAVIAFAGNNLPAGKKVFFIHTAGDPRENQNAAIKAISDGKACRCLGTYFCKGFDTYGPFKLIGGIAKGHPDGGEIAGAVRFFKKLIAEERC